jgi:hypothetical protein
VKTWKLKHLGRLKAPTQFHQGSNLDKCVPFYSTVLALQIGRHAHSNSQDSRRYGISKVDTCLGRFLSLETELLSVWTLETNTSLAPIFFVDLHTCRACHQEQFLYLPINSQKLLTVLIGPHYIETHKLRIQNQILKYTEVLGSPKHVINIILQIRYMVCYNDHNWRSTTGPSCTRECYCSHSGR